MNQYAPTSVMTLKGERPVLRYVAHPPGTHTKSPIRNEMWALEMITDCGSRWYGVERAWINSELRMVVCGLNPRDEVTRKWKECKTI